MKEITRIATVRITSVTRVEDESEIITKEKSATGLENAIRKALCIDDVVVDNVQDFVREV